MTAAPMRPPAIPGPQPPRHRASAGDGKARAVTPTMPAAISANAVLFIIVPFCFSKQTSTGAGGLGFDIRSHRSGERAHSAIAECCRFPAQHSGAPTLVVEGYIGSCVSRRATYGRFIAASTRHVMKTTARPSPVIRASNRESICFSCRSSCLLPQAA